MPVDQRLFTAHLGTWRDELGSEEGQSFYTFGYIDREVVEATGEEIHYVDVDNTNGFWQFPSTKAAVNGHTIDLANNTAIADTGTTLALVSDKVCEAIYSAIPGAFQNERIGVSHLLPTHTSPPLTSSRAGSSQAPHPSPRAR